MRALYQHAGEDTMEPFFGLHLEPQSIRDNPSLAQLKRQSLCRGARKTKRGSIAVFPRVKSRSESATEIIWESPTEEQKNIIGDAFSLMAGKHMIRLDRMLGQGRPYHCGLFISAEHPEPALVWGSLLTPISAASGPLDFMAISIPEYPEPHVYVFPEAHPPYPPLVILLGIDYGGEHKMSFLRQYLYHAKTNDMGLGLHAASMSFVLKKDGALVQKNALFLAESGTGKSTLSSHNYGLQDPERAIFRQDDIVGWSMDGRVWGTEQERFYMIVAGLDRERQPNIWVAANSPRAILENVAVDEDGTSDFSDLSLSRNPRVALLASELGNSDGVIDMPSVDFIFLVTRQFDILPPLMRLSCDAAMREFLNGRTAQTAAADPTEIGAIKRTVGFNPFIMDRGGRRDQLMREGILFRELLRKNPATQVFWVNTGSVGGPKDGGPGDIRIEDSTTLILEAVRGILGWVPNPNFGKGYQIHAGSSVDMRRFNPSEYYSERQIDAIMETRRREDGTWLRQFDGKIH